MATTPVEAAEKAGMPQLDFSTFPNQIFWLAVTLVVTFLLLKLVVLPRVASILAERKGRIRSDLTAAAELKDKAVAAEKAYQDALVRARAEAGKIIAAAKADIQADLTAAIAKADAVIATKAAESDLRINEIKAGAMDAVSAIAKATAGELVAALGGTSDAKAIASAVAARLKG